MSSPHPILRLVPPPSRDPAPVEGAGPGDDPVAGGPGHSLAAEGASDPSVDDDSLMVLARGGVRGAFDTLVRRHQRRVLSFATRFFGDEVLALDVAQDVFVDMLRALPRYRSEGRFSVWLYRLTLNRCRMAARGRRTEDRALGRIFVESRDRLAPDEAVARERERHLGRALAALPEKHRDVLQLRFWGGLQNDEIASVLGAPEGTVKSRMWNALAALREQLGGLE